MTVRFTDVTAETGLSFQHEAGATGKKWLPETMGAGGGFFDYDGDGWLDILLVNSRRWPGERQEPEPTMHLYRNQGDGTFQDVTRQSGLQVPLYGMGMVAADYDNNGTQDLVITGYLETRLFRNEGSGTFTDVTLQSGVAQGSWTTAAVFVDVDRDGWLDLVLGSYVDWDPGKEANLDCTYGTPAKDYCGVRPFRGQGLKLYRNLGDGRFADISVQAGMVAPEARVLGLAVVDYNQDGWPDILVANDLTPSLFFVNQGDGTFRELGTKMGLVLDDGGVAYAGMGIDTAQVNNDAQLCVAIGNFAGQPTTLHCQARVEGAVLPDLFIEQSHRAGIATPTLRMVTFGLFFFDADLDGWPDLFMINGHVANEERLRNNPYRQPPQLFRNRRDGSFEVVQPPAQSGLDLHLIGRGAAHGDYDNDGDLDLLLTANQGAAYLLRNDSPRSGHYLRVVTRGTQSNRDGIGARVRLYTARRQLDGMVRTGSSYLSQSATSLTFGLEAAEKLDRLEVFWPSGAVDVLRHLPVDSTVMAREGDAPATVSIAQPPSPMTTQENDLALKRIAKEHIQAGRKTEGMQALLQVLQRQPDDYVTQEYLIILYWEQGAREQARSLLRTMRQMMPEANFFMQFGSRLDAIQLHDLADEIYQMVLNLDPEFLEAHYRLGNHALWSGRHAVAVSHFRQVLQLQAHSLDSHLGLGTAYAAQGRFEEAEAQFQELLRLAPEFVEAYPRLGKIYNLTGRLDKASTIYKRLITLQPDSAEGYYELGTVSARQGLAAEAAEHYRAALQRDPQHAAAHHGLGTLYAAQGDSARAMTAFRAALQSDPTFAQAHYDLAKAYSGLQDRQAMLHELNETLRLQPQHLEARLNLGSGYLQEGQIEAALQQFRTAVQVAPKLAEAHYWLGVASGRQGQTGAQLAALQQTVRLDPRHARAHSDLAALYFAQRNYELAWQHGGIAAQLGAPIQPLLEKLRRVREQNP